jgi:hypothetical protein
MPMEMIARFRVDGFEPAQVSGLEGDWVSVLTFAKTFTAGIVGRGTTLFLTAGAEGSRSYVATERITGRTDDGREGSFTVQHGGLESDPATWFGHIVPSTGTGDFASWAGSARIIHDADGPYFEINLITAYPDHGSRVGVWGYVRRWQVCTTPATWRRCARGSPTTRRAWTIWTGCGGLTASAARTVAR